MAQSVTLIFGNIYSDDEETDLVDVFEAHGFEVQLGAVVRESATPDILQMIIITVAGLSLKKVLDLFIAQAYDAWLRQPLATTLFKPRGNQDHSQDDSPNAPLLELEGSDATIFITARDQHDLDVAMQHTRDVEDVAGRRNLYATSGTDIQSFKYQDGMWRLYAGVPRTVYVYNPQTHDFDPGTPYTG